MLTNTLSIRNDLFSSDPHIQRQTARCLGHFRPHIELPLIASAINLDIDTQQGRLTTALLCLLCRAANSHADMTPHLHSQAAKANVAEQLDQVAGAAIHWYLWHGCPCVLAIEINRLCRKIEHLEDTLFEGTPPYNRRRDEVAASGVLAAALLQKARQRRRKVVV